MPFTITRKLNLMYDFLNSLLIYLKFTFVIVNYLKLAAERLSKPLTEFKLLLSRIKEKIIDPIF